MSETQSMTTDSRPSVLRSVARSIEPAFPSAADTLRGIAREMSPDSPPYDADVYVVEGPGGFTESFDRRQIDTLERLGLIRHVRDGHVLEDGSGRGVGPLHRFYGPA